MYRLLHLGWAGVAVLAVLAINDAPAAAETARCQQLRSGFGDRLVDAKCTESADLTTANEETTPADNSLPGLPGGAFMPRTDRDAIAPDPPHRTPIAKPVPGIQIEARIADDPRKLARILIRLPDGWNGSLVVAGAPAERSEFASDFAWSDYVVQKGYAYVSQNKGVLDFRLSSAEISTACRLNPSSSIFINFYDDDPEMSLTRWATFMAEAARFGRDSLQIHYGREAQHTYAVGTSNGGYQVRRAVESYPELFDGGVDWEGTFVDPDLPNFLSTLPPAILNYPAYEASGFDRNSTAARNILAAGYPPDLVVSKEQKISLWEEYYRKYWEVTMCLWQKRLDPAYDTYRAGLANYVYLNRVSVSDVAGNLAAFRTTGRIQKPLITVAGTMDALLPIEGNARAYARRVAAAAREGGEHVPAYRLYEVQNGNHIDSLKVTFPQLELIEPHAQRAFDLLVDAVEKNAELPPSQCIPRGGEIKPRSTQLGQCINLQVP